MVSAHEQSIYTNNSKAPSRSPFVNPATRPPSAHHHHGAVSPPPARNTLILRQPGAAISLQKSSESRKRKRDQNASAAFTQRPITIGPCPTTPSDKPVILTPLKLIWRAQLPLSCLDPAHPIPTPGSGSSRLFTAHVEALEAKALHDEEATLTRDCDGEAPKVLVTKIQASNTLFAVERVQRGVYALCKLADWIKLEDFNDVERASSRAQLQSRYIRPNKALKSEHGDAWWTDAVLSDQQPDAKAAMKTDRTPRLQMGRSKPAVSKISTQSDDPFIETQPHDPFADPMAVDGPEMQPERPQTAEEVFQTLVQQYLEMLYLSKTSLAFFVKGPLSRARAAFGLQGGNGTLKVRELAAFFRSILLQLGQVDKKYRGKIPDIVKGLPLPGFSDDEDGTAAAAAEQPVEEKTKKSRPKKLKPNKEGMYPGEDKYVKQWWIKGFPSSPGAHSEETPEDMFKRKAGDLRIRESMAQVVLVLEILALEASPGLQAPDQDEMQQETQADSQPPEKKKKRKEKAQDLHVLLDLLLDKLCIWQTVEQDEMLVKISKSGQGGTAAAETPNSTKAGTSDKLRGFCVEVIIPFYMGRLPETAVAINKRLGGPSASPSKVPGSSSTRSKPGEATTRNPPSVQRSRKPLQRVATENATKSTSRAPSLTRSATDSALTARPVFKHESSEVSLSSIPFMKPAPPASSRNNSLSQFQRFAKREIDLQEMSAATQAKIRKKERIARELKEAISTLSKPNRASAVKEYADSTDRSKMLGLAGSTRPGLTKKSAARTTMAATATSAASSRFREADRDEIQVGATPKKLRRPESSHLVDATPTHHHRSYVVDPHDNSYHLAGTFMQRDDLLAAAAAQPPSSDPIIPASAVRPGPVMLSQMESRSTSYTTSAPFTLSNSTTSSSNHILPFAQRPPNPKSIPFSFPPAENDEDGDNDDTNPLNAAVFATPSRTRAKQKAVSFAAHDDGTSSGSYNPSKPSGGVVAETPPHPAPSHPPPAAAAAAARQYLHVPAVSSFASRLQPSLNLPPPPLPPPPASSSSYSSYPVRNEGKGAGAGVGVVLATPTKPKMKPESVVRGARGASAREVLGRVAEVEVEHEDKDEEEQEQVDEKVGTRDTLFNKTIKDFVDDSDDDDNEIDDIDTVDPSGKYARATDSSVVKTPVKAKTSSHRVEDWRDIAGRVEAEAEAEAEADVDVYKALGWDDDGGGADDFL